MKLFLYHNPQVSHKRLRSVSRLPLDADPLRESCASVEPAGDPTGGESFRLRGNHRVLRIPSGIRLEPSLYRLQFFHVPSPSLHREGQQGRLKSRVSS